MEDVGHWNSSYCNPILSQFLIHKTSPVISDIVLGHNQWVTVAIIASSHNTHRYYDAVDHLKLMWRWWRLQITYFFLLWLNFGLRFSTKCSVCNVFTANLTPLERWQFPTIVGFCECSMDGLAYFDDELHSLPTSNNAYLSYLTPCSHLTQ